ncbi:hypothetical protein [Halopenitus persicus]|uniref:hypothetical protein n=1 Tax=Halopenitus persicus TaxID=1048396 RepID=UPI0012FE00D7|nr:hypothetical protein [Halopenitus persicus]
MIDTDPSDLLEWLEDKTRLMVWADEPRDQLAANLVVFLVALVSSSVTLGATLVIAFITGILAIVGATRLAIEIIRD